MKANVEITTNLNLRLDEVLLESELDVLQTLGEKAVSKARQIWTGWKYGPYYPEEQQGTSGESWAFDLMEPTETEQHVRGIVIVNDAEIQERRGTYELKVFGKPTGIQKNYLNNQVGEKYAAFVTRSGSSQPEWFKVFDAINDELIPQARRDLIEAIEKNAGMNRQRVTFEAKKPTDAVDNFDIVSETLI